MSDNTISSLIDQLKDSTLLSNQIQGAVDVPVVTQENLEQFIIKTSSELITQSMSIMREMRDYAIASNDPEQISAIAELVKASTGAIESLNKIAIQNKKTKAAIMLKTMDSHAKKEISNTQVLLGVVGTREEIFKRILDEARVIDAVILPPSEDSNSMKQSYG